MKENNAPELFIKYIAHDLQCNIIIIDLFNNTVEFCSGNSLLDNNVLFDSPLLLYTTGSHFRSVIPIDHEYFIHYAKELYSKYFNDINHENANCEKVENSTLEDPIATINADDFGEIKRKIEGIECIRVQDRTEAEKRELNRLRQKIKRKKL